MIQTKSTIDVMCSHQSVGIFHNAFSYIQFSVHTAASSPFISASFAVAKHWRRVHTSSPDTCSLSQQYSIVSSITSVSSLSCSCDICIGLKYKHQAHRRAIGLGFLPCHKTTIAANRRLSVHYQSYLTIIQRLRRRPLIGLERIGLDLIGLRIGRGRGLGRGLGRGRAIGLGRARIGAGRERMGLGLGAGRTTRIALGLGLLGLDLTISLFLRFEIFLGFLATGLLMLGAVLTLLAFSLTGLIKLLVPRFFLGRFTGVPDAFPAAYLALEHCA